MSAPSSPAGDLASPLGNPGSPLGNPGSPLGSPGSPLGNPGSPAGAPTEPCPLCNAPLRPDQDWCLSCGAAARTRLAAPPRWKALTIAVAVVALLAFAVLAAALVRLTG